ncbi:MAG: response regulator [Desulfobacterales bacterium]|nr:response regulator [Desulfobacterales bacterium]
MSSKIKHVLVVDDQDNWRRMFKLLLEEEGCQVSLAKDRQEAEDILNSSKFGFDLAVLDVRFKDNEKFNVEGLGLFYFIKDNNPSMKTIITTSYPESVPYKPKVDEFILKVPENSFFDFKEFQRKVRNLLEN